MSATFFSMLLAEAHLAGGDVASADEVVDAALAFAAATDQRVYEHDLYRLKGECVLSSATTRGRKAEATRYFERALAIAADRRALLFELRAATSLFRVREEARERLARLADRFAPEDDCADLRTARALLEIEATGPRGGRGVSQIKAAPTAKPAGELPTPSGRAGVSRSTDEDRRSST
jgi:hypothetical protein